MLEICGYELEIHDTILYYIREKLVLVVLLFDPLGGADNFHKIFRNIYIRTSKQMSVTVGDLQNSPTLTQYL